MSSSTSYYNDPEFKRVLRRYEEARAGGQSVYLDADDFADIVDYYLSRDRLDEADSCVAYALTLHPDHTRLAPARPAGEEVHRRGEHPRGPERRGLHPRRRRLQRQVAACRDLVV